MCNSWNNFIIIAMKETINIKRKEFTVIEKMGENSFKVERHGKVFFLKKYQRRDDLDNFVKAVRRLKITALDIPKLYMFDKDQLISVVDFIEGPTMLDVLLKGKIENEEIYKLLLLDEWYMRKEKVRIDFSPINFKFTGKKLIYLPFIAGTFEQNYSFATKDFRLWFHTREFASYVKSLGLNFDESLIGNEYATNKEMALTAVKYYM